MASDLTYATAYDVEDGFRVLTSEEQTRAEVLLQEAAIIIDAYNQAASTDAKRLVSCRMVRRQLGSGDDGMQFPLGSTQGSASAMGYSQSFTMGSGAVGELYLSKLDKKLLGVGNRIGSHSPLEDMTNAGD